MTKQGLMISTFSAALLAAGASLAADHPGQKFQISPHGLAFHAGYLYVGDVRGIWRFPYADGQTSAGKPEKVTSKVADLAPKNGHITRNIAFGPDGGLYLALGSRDNISDFKPGAQVFKINADGSMSEFASGIRNPVGIAFPPGVNTPVVVTNERY